MAAARLTLAVAVLLAALAAAPASAKLRPHAPAVVGDRSVEAGELLTVSAGVHGRGKRAATLRVLLDDAPLGTRRARRSRRTFTFRVPALAPGTYALRACTTSCRTALLPVRIVVRPVPFMPPPPPPPPLPPVEMLAAEPQPPETQPAPEPEPQLAPFGPACGPPGLITEELPQAPAPAAPAADFTALWSASRRGYTGGDGALSVALPTGEVVWLFGDTFLAGIRTDGTRDPQALPVRNAIVVQDGTCLTTLPAAIEPPADGEWYWPAQGVVSADGLRLHTFWMRVERSGDPPFGFRVNGSALATHALPSLQQEGDPVELPAHGRLFFGAAIVERADATYVYGVDEATPHRLHVARTTTGDLGGPLEFWDGTSWSADVADSAPVLAEEVATQLSVVDRGSDLVLVSQAPFDDDVEAWTAPAPTGPWTPAGTLASVAVEDAWAYNAVLHPWSVTPDGMLLGHSVHPVDQDDLYARPDLYRPRFTRVELP